MKTYFAMLSRTQPKRPDYPKRASTSEPIVTGITDDEIDEWEQMGLPSWGF